MLRTHSFLPYFFRTIRRALVSKDAYYWIGLNDKQAENTWRWVNGHQASASDVTLWMPNEPSGSSANEDCATMAFSLSYIRGNLALDAPCSQNKKAVCEKLLN